MRSIKRSARDRLSGILLFLALLSVSEIGVARCDAQIRADLRQVFLNETPDSPGSIILGRPTDRSITLSILWRDEVQVLIQYGISGKLDKRLGSFVLEAGEPREVIIGNLQPDTTYYYRVVEAATQRPLLPVSGNGRFHTQRATGTSFVFTVQADSHLDGNCSLQLYELTLRNVLGAEPDFHIDLGDTFMGDKISSRNVAAKHYAAQRYWLGQIGHSAPLFLVLGNHDGEEASRRGATGADGFAVWASLQRKRYFSNPVPDGFYTGNAQQHKDVGMLEDYYAWEWGDALFVVLDPYWYSEAARGGRQPWNMTLGKIQYDWLAKTLRSSKAQFRFVFIHQLTGGLDKSGRGGMEAASLYEWGGKEKNGEQTFSAHRPDWEKPIHSLLVENGVTIVFHGHDHFFARQELDGVTYQLVPQPANMNVRNHHAQEYGYEQGDFYPNSGHLHVQVSSQQVRVEYVRTADKTMQGNGVVNGQSAYCYTRDLDPAKKAKTHQ
jgi:hypothetical protein